MNNILSDIKTGIQRGYHYTTSNQVHRDMTDFMRDVTSGMPGGSSEPTTMERVGRTLGEWRNKIK